MTKFIDPSEPIAIIGLGGVFPGAKDIPGYWANILGKKDSIVEVPSDRWDWRLYYDADRKAEDKTYSKIGGFVLDFDFEPLALRIPPGVAGQMDTVQQLAVSSTAMALADAGYDKKEFDRGRTAVIFGNSMGGPKKEASDLRVYTSLFKARLEASPALAKLDPAVRAAVVREADAGVKTGLMAINEDTMPGELSNVIAGRIANTFNFAGPNFTVDAACASSLGAVAQAVSGLRFRQFDLAVTGGVDQMMAPPAYVKFCKIGALSPDGSRPFDDGANGFVMGEGCGALLLKRLGDALKDGDRIYALIRSIGASSDGRGKGITAPNPKGQKLAMERAFEGLNYGPEGVGLLEAHGTSTAVGDLSEIQAASEVFKGVAPGSVAISSVKSQIGHLKAAAGAASLIKAALALKERTLPPTINFKTPNKGVDWKNCPFFVNTEAAEWKSAGPRRANVSAFGFGGTNFHVALEESCPETNSWTPALAALSPRSVPAASAAGRDMHPSLEGEAFTFTGSDPGAVLNSARAFAARAPKNGPLAAAAHSENSRPRGEFVLTVAAENAAKLQEKLSFALNKGGPSVWEKAPPAFKPKSLFPGKRRRNAPKVAFLFPGQGSQYVDMLRNLKEKYRVVAETFAEADRVMVEIIGETLSGILFTEGGESEERLAEMRERIKQTEITQPAVLTADVAIARLLAQYGVTPDVVAGHSLGEYGALVAAGVLSFKNALLAVSARGKEMAGVKVDDNGKMASIAWPVEKVQPVLDEIDGYVIAANKNCPIQTVIAGGTAAVEEAVKRFQGLGVQAVPIEVSHAFHSEIVAPATAAYGSFLDRIKPKAPNIPVSSNVTGGYYPDDAAAVRDLMVMQIAAPVEFIKQVERMYADGVRVFVEVGPKRALTAFVTATLSGKDDVVISSSNHPKRGDIHEFNDMLARLTAAGLPVDYSRTDPSSPDSLYTEEFRARALPTQPAPAQAEPMPGAAEERALLEKWDIDLGPVVVSGIAAGTPGSWDRLFRENAIDDVIAGKNLIEPVPEDLRRKQLDKNLERVVKSETGAHRFETLKSIEQVIRLAGRAGGFSMSKEFGVRGSISSLMDVTAKMGMAAAILAMKDAEIPLVRHYKKTTTGRLIPTVWALPRPLQAETGLIMASAFPGLDSLIQDVSKYFAAKYRREPAKKVWEIYDRMISKISDEADRKELADWYADFKRDYPEAASEEEAYHFSRSFMFRILSLGQAQTAQFLKAKGPCTQINAACASTTQAVGIAEDWIRTGRCKRVVVVAADNVTGEHTWEWLGTGFLASGATTTHDVVSEAAVPFDKRRNGMIIGMGAAGLVIEAGAKAAERGVTPLAQLLASQFDNSAFHVTRLNTAHVSSTMDRLLTKAEKRYGVSRGEIAGKMLFMSHETYTPAQGGSAAAEVEALKHAFRDATPKIVVTNTKGFTGHSMGASIEDVVAVRAMNTGLVPPIANYKEPDPDLAGITLSKGGKHDIEYALRLGAGFGSQIAMTLMKRVHVAGNPRVPDQGVFDAWLRAVTGDEAPELEVEYNTLRVKDKGRAEAEKRKEPALPGARPAVAAEVPAQAPAEVPTPAPAAAPTPAPAGGTGLSKETVTKEILALVSEKTGYPEDMLELDLDMEADLGIDTVKQAELIGIIQERYAIPPQENLSLKDYPTLAKVIGFVLAGGKVEDSPVGAEAPSTAPKAAAPPAPARRTDLSKETVTKEILALVSEKTGYPEDMLELDLDMEADLGIDTVKQAELIGIIQERYAIPPQENLSLKDYPTLAKVIEFVLNGGAVAPAAAPAAAPAPQVPAPKREPAPAAPAAARRTDLSRDAVTKEILALVSEKTGYPEDMLELDLDMEADLGIDTVKQAEMIGIIREKYAIPAEESLSLKDYPTLNHVISFVLDAPAPEARLAAAPNEPIADLAPTPAAEDEENARFAARRVVAYARPAAGSVPVMDAERPAVVLALETETAKPFEEEIAKAGGTAVVIKTADWGTPEKAEAVLRKALGDRKAGAILDLTSLDLPDFEKMTANGFNRNYARTARALFLTAKTLHDDLKEAGAKAWILVVTKMGGTHGVRAREAFQPCAGAVTGLGKALSREFDEAVFRAVDFDPRTEPAETARLALSELGSEDPRREVGYKDGERQALRLVRNGLRDTPVRKITPKSTFLITGGGGALASVLAKEIARRWKCRIVLLDLFPLPKEASVWARMNQDELDAHKKTMWEDMRAAAKEKGERATPAMLEREFGKVLYAVRLHKNMETLIRMGAKVQYHAGDLTDYPALSKALRDAARWSETIDFVVHTAGLEESKLIADKKVENYDRVIRPKAHGAFNLVKAMPPSGGQRWAFFSSVVARFGNLGQTDYATANDFLVKLAARMSAEKHSCAVAFDLTAFADVGMATRGGVKQFLESQGVDFLPPDTGIGIMLDQIAARHDASEVVVSGALGKLDSDGLMEPIEEKPAAAEPAAPPAAPETFTLFDEVISTNGADAATGKTFSLKSDPWLRDHSIDGTAWVAGVMGLELFAETVQGWTGEAPIGLEDVRFALPIKLNRDQPVTVRTVAAKAGDALELRIESDFINKKGIKLGDTRRHFTARVLNGAQAPGQTKDKPKKRPKTAAFQVGAERIYAEYFHGPRFQVLAGIESISEEGLTAVYRKPAFRLWDKGRKDLVFHPMLIEAAFQACGYRDLHYLKKMSLPDSIGRVRVRRGETPPDELTIRVSYKGSDENGTKSVYDAEVVDAKGRVWVVLEDYKMIHSK